MRAHIIGVAGPSGSGKSELARQLVARLPGSTIVTLDSYYRHHPERTREQRARTNFDEPEALEWELLHRHLCEIAQGRGFDEPIYSFPDMLRTAATRRIEPAEVLIVEGLFALHWPELRTMLDTKVYVQTECDVCFQRRLTRDVAERGYSQEHVRRVYEETVLPSARLFVHPARAHADLVVSGEEPLEQSTNAVIAAMQLARSTRV
jgi:uridine kinase